MSDVSELANRMEGVLTAYKDRVKQQEQANLQEQLKRHERLKTYEQAQARIVEIARPRLELLAKRSGDRAKVTPSVSQTRRAVTFEFVSPQAVMTLAFSVAPDRDVNNAEVWYDLRVIPVLWRFNSHAEFRTPAAAVDEAGLSKWLDDRIVEFLDLFIQVHDEEAYTNAEYVEDPVAGLKFPKFAAGATLDHGGQTYYFVDDKTRAEFARQKGIATA
jgi:YHS domain-containing protein